MEAELIISAFEEMSRLSDDKISSVGVSIPLPTFDIRTINEICLRTIASISINPILVFLKGDYIIVGDIHGNLHDLLRIFAKFGLPPASKYLFLGDYVDRGGYSIEVITYLLALQLQYPEYITLLRGNHEFPEINKVYGFHEEVLNAYESEEIWNAFNDAFGYFPIAAILNDTTFCVHGGIAPGFHLPTQLLKISKPINSENITKMVYGLLWADPDSNFHTYAGGTSRAELSFNFYKFRRFLQSSGMQKVVRAHQCVQEGYQVNFDNCLTIFSSSGYSNQNDACVISATQDHQYYVQIFHPIKFPERKIAYFYSLKQNRKQKISQSSSALASGVILSTTHVYPLSKGYVGVRNRNVLNKSNKIKSTMHFISPASKMVPNALHRQSSIHQLIPRSTFDNTVEKEDSAV